MTLGAIGMLPIPSRCLSNPGEETCRVFLFWTSGLKGNTMKIKLKATPKPRNPLVAVAKLRGGAGAHQSETSPRVARRAGKHRLQQWLAGRLKADD